MSKINPLSFGFWVWSLSVRNDFGKPEGKIHIHKRCLSHQHLDSSWPQAKPNKMNLNNWKCLSDTLMSWVCGRKAIASASFIFHLNTLQVCLRMRLDADLNMMQHWGWKCGLVSVSDLQRWCTSGHGEPERGGVRFDCRDAAWFLLWDNVQLINVKSCTAVLHKGRQRTQRLLWNGCRAPITPPNLQVLS